MALRDLFPLRSAHMSSKPQQVRVYQRKLKIVGKRMLETWLPVSGACSASDAQRWLDLSVQLEPREVFRISAIKPRAKELPQ